MLQTGSAGTESQASEKCLLQLVAAGILQIKWHKSIHASSRSMLS